MSFQVLNSTDNADNVNFFNEIFFPPEFFPPGLTLLHALPSVIYLHIILFALIAFLGHLMPPYYFSDSCMFPVILQNFL